MSEYNINTLTVLRNLLSDCVFGAYMNWRKSLSKEAFAEFEYSLLSKGAESNFLAYLSEKILTDENAFSVCCASGKTPSRYLKSEYMHDLNIIFEYVQSGDTFGRFETGTPRAPLHRTPFTENTYRKLKNFYKKNGYGKFINHRAFIYENAKLVPVKNVSQITPDKLIGYAEEKQAIESNILNFLSNLPYGNMLLYGDRGTGKSSTVHAMLNKYAKCGLRMIEINRGNMLDLPKIRQELIDNPLKFIIFIDDLSLNENDDKISGLKAALEGSVSGSTTNTMIVATSNRRHIVKENFSERENSVHLSDSIQEQLALADRFGITVLFSSTDKAQYIEIVKSLASDEKLPVADDELCALAERWALIKGGRSPRRARQFIDFVTSCIKRDARIEF